MLRLAPAIVKPRPALRPVRLSQLESFSFREATMIFYDLRHALRALVRRPGLSLAILLILTLGIGSTTTIFSVASSALLSEIPYKEGNRLVHLQNTTEPEGADSPASYLDAESWRQQSRTLEKIAAS